MKTRRFRENRQSGSARRRADQIAAQMQRRDAAQRRGIRAMTPWGMIGGEA